MKKAAHPDVFIVSTANESLPSREVLLERLAIYETLGIPEQSERWRLEDVIASCEAFFRMGYQGVKD